MANRIQLRRDHSTNWTRINPVLSDGEPGLEIDTNKVKYGNGATAWRDLGYAGAGFRYARIQEGIPSTPLTSITGIDDDGLSLTSNNFAQLMWVPNTDTVTLVDINGDTGGPAHFSWAYVDDTGFNVENKQPSSNFNWQFNFDGSTQFPYYKFPTADGSANQVLKTDGNGTLSWTTISATTNQLVSGSFTVSLDSGTGVLTVPGFMNLTYSQGGADTMNFGTGPGGGSINATSGKSIYLTTNGGDEQWVFGTDGVLTLSTSSTILGNNVDPNVYIETVSGGTTNTWTFSTTGTLTLPDGGTLRIKGSPPNTSKGVAGDKAGMIAFSTGFIYHCYNDYTDGTGDIWGRVAIDNGTF